MRLHDGDDNELTLIYLALSDAEALQLIGYLEQLIADKGKGNHWHCSQDDFQREITIYREDDDTAVF